MLVAARAGLPRDKASNQPLNTPTGSVASTLVTRSTAAGRRSAAIACSTASFWAPYSFLGQLAAASSGSGVSPSNPWLLDGKTACLRRWAGRGTGGGGG